MAEPADGAPLKPGDPISSWSRCPRLLSHGWNCVVIHQGWGWRGLPVSQLDPKRGQQPNMVGGCSSEK